MDNRELIEACILGEEDAWKEFLARFGGLIYHAAQRRVQRLDLGAEAVEDAFSAVVLALLEDNCRRLREFRWDCALQTWLAVVAARLVSNYFRSALRGTRLEHEVSEEVLFLVVDSEPPPGTRAERREELEQLRTAMAQLPERDRLILVAFHVDGRSYAEIARLLGVPVSSVGQMVARARDRLKQRLSSQRKK